MLFSKFRLRFDLRISCRRNTANSVDIIYPHVMKSMLIISVMFSAFDLQGQPRSQRAFCKFVASFNEQQFDAVYNEFSDDFKKRVDRAVVTGGLLHVFESHGQIGSAIIERQSSEEGWYVAISDRGAVRIMLSVDAEERIDGLKIKVIGVPASPRPTLVFASKGGDGG